jgi:hypothetical protein
VKKAKKGQARKNPKAEAADREVLELNNRNTGSSSGQADRFTDLFFLGPSRDDPSNLPKTFGGGPNAMKRKLYALFLYLGLSMAALAMAEQAQATLGESADSVASDRKALSAVQRATTARNGYTVHEFALDGTFVREYVSPSGIVFGIAWNGLTYPDLTPLLGSYASEYQAALRQTPRRPGLRRYQTVKTDRIVVQKWGHMRNLQGRAYAPALIPPGVSIDEIK